MSRSFPRSLPEFQAAFPDDAACIAYLEKHRWPRGFKCPHCDRRGDPYRFSDRATVLRCRGCHRDTSVTSGTVLERAKLPLVTWFAVAFLALHSATPASLQRDLRLTRRGTAAKMRDRLIWAEGSGWPRFRRSLGI